VLLPLYGSLGIQSFGLSVVIGLLVSLYLMKTHTLCVHRLSFDELYRVLFVALCASIVGGKLLFVSRSSGFGLTGFSLMGSIFGFLVSVPVYLKVYNIPLWPVLDLCAIHAPLLQSISRIGCFFAGCCYGNPSNVRWAVMYTDPFSFAPLNTYLHPTQLYSALILAGIFLTLRNISTVTYVPGNPLLFYLGAIGFERFVMDFFRGDRDYFDYISFISVHQLIALLLLIGSILAWNVIHKTKRSETA
jgi:phosphatidylglycerol---prolipoprotein diacylglyceryl transferase